MRWIWWWNCNNLAREIIKKHHEGSVDLPSAPGNYIIVSVLKQPLNVSFNPLWQERLIHSGYYFYCGSAHGPGGLKARVQYHLRENAEKHWHFDRLKKGLNLIEIWWDAAEENNECIFSQGLQKHSLSNVPLPGFGSSDCLDSCGSHLIHFPSNISLSEIYNFLQKSGYELERLYL